MKDKGILKFKGTESRGAMHYLTYNGDTVSLTTATSRKVKHIKVKKGIEIANSLISRTFVEMKVEIDDDIKYVEEVYNFMRLKKHTHYKTGFEGLVVLKLIEE